MYLCILGACNLVRDVGFFSSKRGRKSQRLASQNESQIVLYEGSLENQN